MSDLVTLDHYRQRAEQEHGHKQISLSDGSVVTLMRPLRMSDEQRARMFEARTVVRKATEEHPDLVAAREAYTQALESRNKLSDKAHQGTIEKRDEALAAAKEKLDAAWAEHGVDIGVLEQRTIAAQREFIRAVADTQDGADKLLAELDGDFYMLQLIIADWDKVSEPGEASPSPS